MTTYIVRSDLKRAHKKSCGCIDGENGKRRLTTHGMTYSRENAIWRGMLNRCRNPKSKAYANYGGRGINVCDEWTNNFMTFYTDMGPCPDKNSTIDRTDNNKNYCKENCKWTSRAEQNRNKRNSRLITYNGKTQCIVDWDKELGFRCGVIGKRLKRGWTLEQAMTLPEKYRFSKKSTI